MTADIANDPIADVLGSSAADQRLATSVLAEHVRVALYACSSGPAVTTRSVLSRVTDRLAPWQRSSRDMYEQFFGVNDEPSTVWSAKDVISDLVLIGDLVELPRGYLYPAATRLVMIGGAEALLLSGAPSFSLHGLVGTGESFRSFARIITPGSADKLPRQSLHHWLGAPSVELAAWTREQFTAALPKIAANAETWEFAEIARRGVEWRPAAEAARHTRTLLCREPRTPHPGYRWFIARLRRTATGVAAIEMRELARGDGRRLLHGLHLLAGTPRRLFARHDGAILSLRISRFALPEVLRLLTAFSFDSLDAAGDHLHFKIAAEYGDSIRCLVARLGFQLTF